DLLVRGRGEVCSRRVACLAWRAASRRLSVRRSATGARPTTLGDRRLRVLAQLGQLWRDAANRVGSCLSRGPAGATRSFSSVTWQSHPDGGGLAVRRAYGVQPGCKTAAVRGDAFARTSRGPAGYLAPECRPKSGRHHQLAKRRATDPFPISRAVPGGV